MKFKVINPATEEVTEHEAFSKAEITFIAQYSKDAFNYWKETPLTDRITIIKKLGEVLLRNKETYAKLASTAMGKPIKAAIAKIQKYTLTTYHSLQ